MEEYSRNNIGLQHHYHRNRNERHVSVRNRPTFAQQNLWRNVVGRAHQRVGEASLVLPRRPLLQGHQAVATGTVGHVIPEVTGLHAVLPHMASWRTTGHRVRDTMILISADRDTDTD